MDVMSALRKTVTAIREWVDENKVQKISGKGLSTNDYTDADKSKVAKIDAMPNDLVVLDNKLYLAQDGVIINDSAVTLPSGGGGGGSSGSVTLTNNLSSTMITAVVGGDVLLEFNYMSSEDETGYGTAYIYVNDVLKITTKITPGNNTINIGAYVIEGTNIIKLTCMDQYSNYRNLSYTVEMISLQLSSTFDATIPYNSDINYTYTPVVNATKTVHFIVDGSEIGTDEITTSGRQETYVIPQQPHGSHTLEVYFTIDLNGTEVPSNHLYYDLMNLYGENGNIRYLVKQLEEQRRREEEAKRAAEEEAKRAAITKRTGYTPKPVAVSQRVEGKRMIFWVFQGKSFDREFRGGYIWAPISNQAGMNPHHWTRLIDVRKGDIILHGCDGMLKAISVAKGSCFECKRPRELEVEDLWDADGRMVECDYVSVMNPIKTATFVSDIIRLCQAKYSPFDKDGNGNMGYLFEINRELAKIFVAETVRKNRYLSAIEYITELLAEDKND